VTEVAPYKAAGGVVVARNFPCCTWLVGRGFAVIQPAADAEW